jgi:hypothetical protein
MYAVGFVAAAQVIGVDIAPLLAVGELVSQHILMLCSALHTCPAVYSLFAQQLQMALMHHMPFCGLRTCPVVCSLRTAADACSTRWNTHTSCCDLPACLHPCAGGAGSIIIGLATQQLLTNAFMGLSLVREQTVGPACLPACIHACGKFRHAACRPSQQTLTGSVLCLPLRANNCGW